MPGSGFTLRNKRPFPSPRRLTHPLNIAWGGMPGLQLRCRPAVARGRLFRSGRERSPLCAIERKSFIRMLAYPSTPWLGR